MSHPKTCAAALQETSVRSRKSLRIWSVSRRDFPQFSVTLPPESLISGKACPRSNFAC